MKFKENKNPNHIGIILDGNGRWATKRGLPRYLGHKAGMEAVKLVIENCVKLKIKILSLFAFSTENWKRDKKEVSQIFDLLKNYADENKEQYLRMGIKLNIFGDLEKCPEELKDSLKNIAKLTEKNKDFILNLCINYGGRSDIVHAVNKILLTDKKKITEEIFKSYLYSKNLPDPDLIIRTGGELRLSNFMLYQCAYSELYFTKVLWPDFKYKELKLAIESYQNRNRKFGNVEEKK